MIVFPQQKPDPKLASETLHVVLPDASEGVESGGHMLQLLPGQRMCPHLSGILPLQQPPQFTGGPTSVVVRSWFLACVQGACQHWDDQRSYCRLESAPPAEG